MTAPANDTTLQRRTRMLAVAVLLLTLIAGIGIGWAIGRRPHGPRGFGRGAPGREMPREARPGEPGRMFGSRLNLTDAQQKQVDSIFAATRTDVAAFWEGPGARLRQIIDSTSVKVRSVLDSTQRVEFDKMQLRRQRMRGPWDGHGGRGGPPGPPPPEEMGPAPPPR
jgi:hypothetical protein